MRGRIRTVKPELFKDEELWDLQQATGLPVTQAFIGLWCYADREGRFEWKPRQLKSDILPYWEGDFGAVLEALAASSFIVRYTVEDREYGYIRTFGKHQVINNKEQPSTLPGPDEHAKPTREPREGFVYLATFPGAEAFKVGFARRDPSLRINDLSCGSPEPLVLVEHIKGSVDLETQIHRLLAAHLKHREWFHATDESIAVIRAWFTRDPRVAVQENPFQGERKGKERNGKGTGREGLLALATPDATPLHRDDEPDSEPVSYTRVPDDWQPSEALYADAFAHGVPREVLDEDVTYWRARKTLGGEFTDLDGFFRAHFKRLAKRRETEAFKAARHGPGGDGRLERQADRIRLLREQEAQEGANP